MTNEKKPTPRRRTTKKKASKKKASPGGGRGPDGKFLKGNPGSPGKPPTYKRDVHPALLVQIMAEGATLVEAAHRMGVHRTSLYVWEQRYPEFAAAKKMAMQASQAAWEKNIREAVFTGRPISSNLAIFVMCNRFSRDGELGDDGYVSKQAHDVTHTLDPIAALVNSVRDGAESPR